MVTEGSQPEDEVSVVVIDDHDLFRGGLRHILNADGLKVVGEASDAARGIELVSDIAPDVVVMDLNTPGMSGTEATRHVTARTRVSQVPGLTIASDRGA